VTCPYCHRSWTFTLQPKVGALKTRLLAHLRAAHGPLRRADVRALHALSATAFRTLITPR